MKERPILFNSEMVRAVLDGSKTQTRRVIKPQPHPSARLFGYLMESTDNTRKRGDVRWDHGDGASYSRSPYGVPGDRLWLRENHYQWGKWIKNGLSPKGRQKYRFKRLQQMVQFPDTLDPDHPHIRYSYSLLVGWHKRPSIFLPWKFSRILLEVVSVRVERVQKISEEDARAEGVYNSGWYPTYSDPSNAGMAESVSAKENFAHLWDSINAKRGYSWDANPWIWIVEFKRI